MTCLRHALPPVPYGLLTLTVEPAIRIPPKRGQSVVITSLLDSSFFPFPPAHPIQALTTCLVCLPGAGSRAPSPRCVSHRDVFFLLPVAARSGRNMGNSSAEPGLESSFLDDSLPRVGALWSDYHSDVCDIAATVAGDLTQRFLQYVWRKGGSTFVRSVVRHATHTHTSLPGTTPNAKRLCAHRVAVVVRGWLGWFVRCASSFAAYTNPPQPSLRPLDSRWMTHATPPVLLCKR